MANQQASKDDNDVSSLLVVSSVDGSTMKVKGNPVTGAMLVDTSGGFINPMTTTGDMIYSSDNSGTPSRLAIGSASQVLGVSGGIPTWIAVPASNLVVGTSTISSGTTTRILYDNAGVLGEYTISGSGTVVAMATSPSFTTPTLGVATATSINGLTITSSTGTLTITNAKTLSILKTMSLTAADDTGVYTLPTGTKTLVATDVATLSSLTSVGTITTGGLGTGATLGSVTVNIASTAMGDLFYAGASNVLTRLADVAAGQPLLSGGVTTAPAYAGYTFSGTAAQTYTFPSTTATLARTDAAQTFTGTQTFSQVITTANAITAVANAATVPVTSRHNIVTNNSAATLTITLTTTSAVNMQTVIVQILDFSAVAQTITWVNTENSGVSAPTTSNGSTSLPLTVGFIYNSSTSKWRCIASA